MIDLFFFIFGSIGMTHILIDGSIFEPVRNYLNSSSFFVFNFLSKLLSCYVCTGWWAGLFCSYFLFNNIDLIRLFAAACTSSFLSSFAAIFLNYLEARTIVSLGDDGDK